MRSGGIPEVDEAKPTKERPSSTKAAAWTLAARQSDRLLGVISIAVLARVLSPSEFGIVAIAGSVVALVEVLSAFGFDWALMRVRARTRAHYDTAWTLRVLSGVVTFAILAAVAHPAAIYFRQPAVAAIVVLMGVNSVIGALENIGIVDFRLEMRFDREFRLRIAGKLAGIVVSVGWALATHSYWALVFGITASKLAGTVLSYLMHDFRPRWDLSQTGVLLNFSVWLMIGNVADVMSSRFADIWVGRHLGSARVGLYSMASELSTLATTEFAAPINRAVYTRYLEMAGDIPRLREAFVRVSGVIWAVGFPAAFGLGVCAHQIVALLLGGQWRDAAGVLQVLAAAGVISITAANTHYVYWALGRSKFVTVLSLIGTVGFVVLTIILGRRFGLIGVAMAQVFALSAVVVVNYVALLRTLELRAWTLLLRNYRVVVASVLMAVIAWWVGELLSRAGVTTVAIQLASMVSAGAVGYCLILFGLWLVLRRPEGPEHQLVELIHKVLGRPSEKPAGDDFSLL
jgi:O-antigen/teichoic acid export membrane protein